MRDRTWGIGGEVDVTRAELRERRVALSHAWSSFQVGRQARGIRAEVAASWQRSARHGTDHVTEAPVDADDDVQRAWAASPVRGGFAAIEADLRQTAEDCDYVAAVTDQDGRILWTAGGTTMRQRAERVNFVPGGRWDEASVGTNALDLALREQVPTTVYSAEHFSPAVHGWVCYAAPVAHPVSGDLLGVLDLSSTWDRAHPFALATVSALARTLAAALAHADAMPPPARRRAPLATPASGPPVDPDPNAPIVLRLLGRGEIHLDGLRRLLPRRQIEILALLTLHPAGLGLEELHAALYGDQPVATATLKAELSHLRRGLDGGIGSRPYALTRPVRCDALDVLAALRAGDLAAAVAAYGGTLLPWSESPGLTTWRHHLDVAIRTAVLAGSDGEAAVGLSDVLPEDAVIAAHASALLAPADPRQALLAARIALAET